MNTTTLIIGSVIALVSLPSIYYYFFKTVPRKFQLNTNSQVNGLAVVLLLGAILILPIVWFASVFIVSGLSYLTPMQHLLLWGTVVLSAILVGALALIRKNILVYRKERNS